MYYVAYCVLFVAFLCVPRVIVFVFFFQAEDGIRDRDVTGSSDVCSSDLLVNAAYRFDARLADALYVLGYFLPLLHFEPTNLSFAVAAV